MNIPSKDNWDDPKYNKFDEEYDIPPHYIHAPVFRFEDDFELQPSKNIVLRNGTYGRSVFAAQNIKSGTVVDDSPLIYINNNLNCPILSAYVFNSKYNDYVVLLFGYGSMFNHSEEPNLSYGELNNTVIRFSTIRDIKKDEELTISYEGKKGKWGEIKKFDNQV